MTGGPGPRRGRRVVVTGLGVVSPAGCTLDDFWSAVAAGPTGPPPDDLTGFDPRRYLSRPEVNRSSPYVHLAVGAGAMAWDDAGAPEPDPRRTGVVIAHAHGPADRMREEDLRLEAEGPRAVSPYLPVLAAENAPASALAALVGARGPAVAVGGGCASGTYAVVDGADLVRWGRCDVVLAGGTAGLLTEALLAAYANLRVLSDVGMVRPFDDRRDGFLYRPGAALLVLEALESAEARGARAYAEVLGGACTNDAGHPVVASGEGARECVALALDDAGVTAEQVVHLNAHGSATRPNDQLEAELVAEVLGPQVAVTSIKGVTGHTLGAAGSLEALAVCLSYERRALPPAVVDLEPDPAIAATGIDVVHGEARAWTPGIVLSSSYGLGGQNGGVVFGPPPVSG